MRNDKFLKKLNKTFPASERESGPVSPKCLVLYVLLFLLAEQTEAFLLVFLFVLLPLARTRLGGERDGSGQRLSAPRRRRAGAAALCFGAVGTGVQDGLNPGTHLLLWGATEVRELLITDRLDNTNRTQNFIVLMLALVATTQTERKNQTYFIFGLEQILVSISDSETRRRS